MRGMRAARAGARAAPPLLPARAAPRPHGRGASVHAGGAGAGGGAGGPGGPDQPAAGAARNESGDGAGGTSGGDSADGPSNSGAPSSSTSPDATAAVRFRGHTLAVPHGATLRSALLRGGLSPHNGGAEAINCRGLGTCGTCAVEIRCAGGGGARVGHAECRRGGPGARPRRRRRLSAHVLGPAPRPHHARRPRASSGAVAPPSWTAAERLRLNFPPHAPPGNARLRLACQVRPRAARARARPAACCEPCPPLPSLCLAPPPTLLTPQ
jgi:hypothetical protein